MRKGLILVVALLCMASMMAAMAYTSAEVTNPASMQILNSSKAYLNIYKAHHTTEVGYKDINFYEENGVAKLDFTRGIHFTANGTLNRTGFQPGSKYVFSEIFRVGNQSTDNVDMWMEVDGLTNYISIKAGSTDLIVNGQATGNKKTISWSSQTPITVIFEVPLNAAESGDVNLNELLNGTVKVFAEPK